jgi:hypothetical protein
VLDDSATGSESDNELCPIDIPQVDELKIHNLEVHGMFSEEDSDSSTSSSKASSDHSRPASLAPLHTTERDLNMVEDDFGCIDEYFHTMDESSISAMRARQSYNEHSG